jgi:hypothetical protein
MRLTRRESQRADPGWLWAAIFGVAALGLALRVIGSFKNFWLDEIWSYYLAQELESVWDVVAQRKHDNNHILNTLFVHWVGEREHWIGYRLLSIVTGSASIVALALVAARRGAIEALVVSILAAASYPLILASGQSRGYAPAIFFSLVALLAIDNYLREPRYGWLVLFWGACCLGILSHLTFLYAYLSILVWSLFRARDAGGGVLDWLRVGMLCHAVPLAVVAALYLGFYREIVLGGGPRDYDAVRVIREALTGALGFHTYAEPWLWTGFALGGGVAAMGLWLLRSARDRSWILLLGAVVVAPAVVLLVAAPRLFYARYLVASIPFFYLLVAVVLGAIARRGRIGRLLCGVVVVVFLAAHLSEFQAFRTVGVTSYRDALDYLDAHTAGRKIRVGSDHDFRNSLVLRFYRRYWESDKRMVYVERDRWKGVGPEWYLAHSWLAGMDPPAHLVVEGRSFTRVAWFDHGRGYGFSWFLYRNDGRPAPP